MAKYTYGWTALKGKNTHTHTLWTVVSIVKPKWIHQLCWNRLYSELQMTLKCVGNKLWDISECIPMSPPWGEPKTIIPKQPRAKQEIRTVPVTMAWEASMLKKKPISLLEIFGNKFTKCLMKYFTENSFHGIRWSWTPNIMKTY